MRVVEITCEPIQYGGQEKFIANVVGAMGGADLRVDVLTPYACENDDFRRLIRSKGGDVFELNLGFRPGRSRRGLLGPMTRFLRERRCDVVHVHSGSTSALAYGALAARRAGARRIIVHSHCTGIPSIRQKLIRLVFGFVMERCATDFFACSRQAGEMRFPRSVVERRLTVIDNGIPIRNYARNAAARARMRSALGIPEGCFVVGNVGRLSNQKNHAFLVELFREVHRRVPDSRLLLVGDGELRGDLRKRVDDAMLGDSVIFTGNVTHVEDYYQAMDVLAFPSLYEGFPIVVLEAQAAGLPCVISTGVPEAAALGRNVVRLELADRERWVEAIVACRGVGPADNAEALRSAGYDIADTAQRLRRIYEAAV